MSDVFTTDNIDGLVARSLAYGWEIAFRSTNAGMHHQLYVNGRLADWSDTTEQRSFLLPPVKGPCRIAIAAVDRRRRDMDMSGRNDDLPGPPDWVCSVGVPRTSNLGLYDRVALLGDHATGEMDPTPLVIRDVRPNEVDLWGHGPFGLEGSGMGGLGTPGFGAGAFGAGEFGFDADLIFLETVLNQSGLHHLLVRILGQDGGYADSEPFMIAAAPPPPAPTDLAATVYDAQTHTLTLEWQPGRNDNGE
jgi:hypothetical protein